MARSRRALSLLHEPWSTTSGGKGKGIIAEPYPRVATRSARGGTQKEIADIMLGMFRWVGNFGR